MTEPDLFTRLAATHKPDCLLSLDGPLPQAVPNPDELSRTLGSDTVARYAQDCRPIYEDLRRVIGQLSGLLILARLTAKSDIADLPEAAQCRARWVEAGQRLGCLNAPAAVQGHKAQLDSAHSFCGQILAQVPQLRRGPEAETQFDRMTVQIKRAYAHLEAASAPKAGLQMVDFTHACCACTH
ncbi:MAG: hypothetical protein CFE34_05725 [Rhodobacteraceae bacterium PARR1]|nr:MAG: hypothetical protein CFE34_05725 [Rhodobacteraceae bacterium PARR1]